MSKRDATSRRPVPQSAALSSAVIFACSLFLIQSCEAGERALQARHDWTRSATEPDGAIECRLIHAATDQCAFVRMNCSDESQDLISFLNLYYCIFPKAHAVLLVGLLLWLTVLFNTMAIAAGDFLCVNLGTMARMLGMSETLAGVTFFAFGNGSSDLFSTFAAMTSNSGSLAIGELYGAASFITAVVVGSMAIVHPFTVVPETFTRDVSFFIVTASLTLIFIADGELAVWECAVIVGFYLFYVVFVIIWHWHHDKRRKRPRDGTVDVPEVFNGRPHQATWGDRPDTTALNEPAMLVGLPSDDLREDPSGRGSMTQQGILGRSVAQKGHGDATLPDEHPNSPTQQLQTSDALTRASATSDVPRSSTPRKGEWTLLPSPPSLTTTLFPTLNSWRSKRLWAKALAILSVPSVFLLTLTVPVIESAQDHDHQVAEDDTPGTASHHFHVPNVADHSGQHGESFRYTDEESLRDGNAISEGNLSVQADSGAAATSWERWPVCIQFVTGPLFLVLNICSLAQVEIKPLDLLLASAVSILVSLICITVLVYCTSPSEKPSWASILSFPGFVFAIVWISSIAGEVVATLKALGVVTNVSDAILGLTIFAIGNSCNDLVADITVAKLGYPAMALSACFGSPMLNILLGIGIGGLYMTLNDQHRDANGRLTHGPYKFHASNTLFTSGATLVVGLLGLLTFVSLNRWRLDRKIGWTLIALWSISTTASVIFELSGAAARSHLRDL